jgi:hypothetical protein
VNYRIVILAALVVFTSSACTSTRQFTDSGYKPPAGDYKLIIMQPDINVGVLTAGGLVEPREDWTNESREHILNALVSQQSERGGKTTVAAKLEDAGDNLEELNDMTALHNAVGGAIITHKYLAGPNSLPTKKGSFDWTLGKSAVDYGVGSDYDYALFLHVETSFASGGRKTLQVAGWLSCAVGVCVGVTGGRQVAFASLVDLETGRLTWFNTLVSGVGDIREADGAADMVTRLLGPMMVEVKAK